MKPGIYTSEFWVTLLTGIAGVVTIIHPGFHIPDSTITTCVASAGTILAAIHYTFARTSLKKTVATATAEAR